MPQAHLLPIPILLSKENDVQYVTLYPLNICPMILKGVQQPKRNAHSYTACAGHFLIVTSFYSSQLLLGVSESGPGDKGTEAQRGVLTCPVSLGGSLVSRLKG